MQGNAFAIGIFKVGIVHEQFPGFRTDFVRFEKIFLVYDKTVDEAHFFYAFQQTEVGFALFQKFFGFSGRTSSFCQFCNIVFVSADGIFKSVNGIIICGMAYVV